jgi:hypothetical protein
VAAGCVILTIGPANDNVGWLKAALLVCMIPPALAGGGLGGYAIARLIQRPMVQRRKNAIAALLPTASPITGVVPGTTPAATTHRARLANRKRQRVLVAFTADAQAWLVGTKARSTKPDRVLGSSALPIWTDQPWVNITVATIGGYEVGLPRLAYRDLFPTSGR